MSDSVEVRHLTVARRLRYALLGDRSDPTEVWFALHGYGQLAPAFLDAFRPLAGSGRLLVAPEGLHRYYTDRREREVGASWMTSEDRLTDIGDYVRYLDDLHGEVLVESGGAALERVTALGFSQGVHTLCRWLAFGEARVDRAILWGSHVPPDLDLEEHGDRLARAEIVLVSGEGDPHFGTAALRDVSDRLGAHDIPVRDVRFPGGHELDEDLLLRLAGDAGDGGCRGPGGGG